MAELAFKATLLDHRANWPRGTRGHDLAELLRLERSVRGRREESAAWEDALVERLDQAAMAGRYPDSRGGEALGDDMCCVSATGLLDAVMTLAGLVSESAERARDGEDPQRGRR